RATTYISTLSLHDALPIYLFEVGPELLQQAVARRYADDRHVLIHQRQGPVLELASGVGFGVDIRDFLELERTFHGDGVVRAASQDRKSTRLNSSHVKISYA